MDHRMYAAEQTEQLGTFQNDRGKTEGLVLHQMSQVQKTSVSTDGGLNSMYVVGDNMHSDFGAKKHLESISKVLSWCAFR